MIKSVIAYFLISIVFINCNSSGSSFTQLSKTGQRWKLRESTYLLKSPEIKKFENGEVDLEFFNSNIILAIAPQKVIRVIEKGSVDWMKVRVYEDENSDFSYIEGWVQGNTIQAAEYLK